MIRGRGLHAGRPSSVAFERSAGPLRLRVDGHEAALDALAVVDTTRSTTLGNDAVRVGTVEHVLAALAGAGVRSGVTVVIEGPELPLADGGAAAFSDLLAMLGPVPTSRPALAVMRAGRVTVGSSVYDFAPAAEIDVEVEVELGRSDLARHARWQGDAADFRARIAPARTFGFEHELGDLLARGLASHVTPESVVVIGTTQVLSAGAPFTPDEPARHKLLDLIGDLFVHGGPPRGRVRAFRPGHAATHAALARARAEGLVARDTSE